MAASGVDSPYHEWVRMSHDNMHLFANKVGMPEIGTSQSEGGFISECQGGCNGL